MDDVLRELCPAIVESGGRLEHGVPLSDEGMQTLRSEIAQIEKEIDTLNQDIQSILTLLGIKDEKEMSYMLEVEFPEKWISRAKDIAFAILREDADLIREEQSRYPPNMSTIDMGELRDADRELYGLARERNEILE